MKNELTFDSCENCMTVAKILLEEEYVVMLSREEKLYVLNYEWSEHADRNNVVFMSEDEFGQMLREEQNDENN